MASFSSNHKAIFKVKSPGKKRPVNSIFDSRDLKEGIQEIRAVDHGIQLDPVAWIEEKFFYEGKPVRLYSNQIKDVRALFDPSLNSSGFASIAVRGAGKSLGITLGCIAFCALYPGLVIIMAGPINKQAGRLLREAYTYLKDPACKASKYVDWGRSNKTFLAFLDGSYMEAISGQEKANTEGGHGHILIVDEAHKVPSYSYTNKMSPMLGSKKFNKTVLIGLASHNNFFRRFCQTPGARVNRCPWDKAEIFQDKEDCFFYRGKPYSRTLLNLMPVPYKKIYFPDRPDLQKPHEKAIPTDDWDTEYELKWLANVRNFLSEKDAETLGRGNHQILQRAVPGEHYFAGLDTAAGSASGHNSENDRTVLSIWRVKQGKTGRVKERVACWVWQGDPLSQKREIFSILSRDYGLFPNCEFILVDYSNIGIDIVNEFREEKLPILGKHFGQTETRSRKNFKNAMFEHFKVELQSGRCKYPSIPDLEDARVLPDLEDALMAQVRNHLEGFDEWLVLERIKGKSGLNDKIQAPEEVVENGEGKIVRIHDDHTSSDVLATWCADHQKELQEELSKSGVGYFIPAASVGIGVTSSMRLGGGMGAIQSGNPIQAMQNLMLSRQQQQIKPTQPKGKPKDWLKSVLGPR